MASVNAELLQALSCQIQQLKVCSKPSLPPTLPSSKFWAKLGSLSIEKRRKALTFRDSAWIHVLKQMFDAEIKSGEALLFLTIEDDPNGISHLPPQQQQALKSHLFINSVIGNKSLKAPDGFRQSLWSPFLKTDETEAASLNSSHQLVSEIRLVCRHEDCFTVDEELCEDTNKLRRLVEDVCRNCSSYASVRNARQDAVEGLKSGTVVAQDMDNFKLAVLSTLGGFIGLKIFKSLEQKFEAAGFEEDLNRNELFPFWTMRQRIAEFWNGIISENEKRRILTAKVPTSSGGSSSSSSKKSQNSDFRLSVASVEKYVELPGMKITEFAFMLPLHFGDVLALRLLHAYSDHVAASLQKEEQEKGVQKEAGAGNGSGGNGSSKAAAKKKKNKLKQVAKNLERAKLEKEMAESEALAKMEAIRLKNEEMQRKETQKMCRELVGWVLGIVLNASSNQKKVRRKHVMMILDEVIARVVEIAEENMEENIVKKEEEIMINNVSNNNNNHINVIPTTTTTTTTTSASSVSSAASSSSASRPPQVIVQYVAIPVMVTADGYAPVPPNFLHQSMYLPDNTFARPIRPFYPPPPPTATTTTTTSSPPPPTSPGTTMSFATAGFEPPLRAVYSEMRHPNIGNKMNGRSLDTNSPAFVSQFMGNDGSEWSGISAGLSQQQPTYFTPAESKFYNWSNRGFYGNGTNNNSGSASVNNTALFSNQDDDENGYSVLGMSTSVPTSQAGSRAGSRPGSGRFAFSVDDVSSVSDMSAHSPGKNRSFNNNSNNNNNNTNNNGSYGFMDDISSSSRPGSEKYHPLDDDNGNGPLQQQQSSPPMQQQQQQQRSRPPSGSLERVISQESMTSSCGSTTVISSPPSPANTNDVVSILTRDVMEFAEGLKEIANLRRPWQDAVVAQVRQAVKELWPSARVELFGSFATGLSIPSSDVDLVVCDVLEHYQEALSGKLQKRSNCLQRLSAYLQKRLGGSGGVQVVALERASLPLIKMTTAFGCSGGGIRLDISFDGPSHRGIATCAYVRQLVDKHPQIVPLSLVLKQFLVTKGLSDPFSGGLSSYGLILLIASVTVQRSRVSRVEPSIGMLLLEFLETFGYYFEPHLHGISSNFVRFNRMDNSMDPLMLQDPLFPANNVGRSCFGIAQVRAAFSSALATINALAPNFVAPGSSILGGIFNAQHHNEVIVHCRNVWCPNVPPAEHGISAAAAAVVVPASAHAPIILEEDHNHQEEPQIIAPQPTPFVNVPTNHHHHHHHHPSYHSNSVSSSLSSHSTISSLSTSNSSAPIPRPKPPNIQ